MRIEENIQKLNDEGLLDKIYGFAYKRCSNSYEAEDLCSEIVVTILKSINKTSEIADFHAFIWTIAHRVYADFATRRKIYHDHMSSYDGEEEDGGRLYSNSIEDYIEAEDDMHTLKRIRREIAFLSKKHREVMVMYYLDEMKVYDIANQLEISETAVKQRLFSARKIVKKEVGKMDKVDLALKPIRLSYYGWGKQEGNNPTINAYRVLAQNIVYFCKDTPRSIKEISEHLHIPLCFLEEEVEAQCYGENGKYGLLKRLDNGKYIANIIMIEADKVSKVEQIYMPYVTNLATKLEEFVEVNKDKLLGCLTVGADKGIPFITWPILMYTMDQYNAMMIECIKEKYLKNVCVRQQPYQQGAIVIKQGEVYDLNMYGIDGINGQAINGYQAIQMFNVYGTKIGAHFRGGHNISLDPLILITIKAIHGIDKTLLTEHEKEIVAEAIEKEYLEVRSGRVYPKILIVDEEGYVQLIRILEEFRQDISEICEKVIDATYKSIMKYVPKHLMQDYNMFINLITINVKGKMIDHCIEQGILTEPKDGWCAEGVAMIVS